MLIELVILTDSADEIEKLGAVGPFLTSEVQPFATDREFEIDRQGLPPVVKDRQQPSFKTDHQGLPIVATAAKDRQELFSRIDRQESSVKEYQQALSVEHRTVANETNGGEKSIDTLKVRQTSLKNDRQSSSSSSITDRSLQSSQELIESAALIFKSSTEHERSQSYRQTKDRQDLFDSQFKQKSSSFVHRATEKEENSSFVHEKLKEKAEIEKEKRKDERKKTEDSSEIVKTYELAAEGILLTFFRLC